MQPAHWSNRLRVTVVAFLLIGVYGAVALRHSISEAGRSDFTPHLVATFKDDKSLKVGVVLENAKNINGHLNVMLVNRQGRTLSSVSQNVVAGKRTYLFELAQPRADTADVEVRCHLNDESMKTPLAKVLLAKPHETSLAAGQEMFTGSHASIRCAVQGIRTLTESVPLHSEVVVKLVDKDGKAHELARGETDKHGIAVPEFDVPELTAGQYTLVVLTKSVLGEEKIERPVQVKSDTKILLVTDKPMYQPGQLMHLRALALRPTDLRPIANQDIIFEVEDSRGNKVFKRKHKTSEYGIASIDFQLADEVNMGNYNLRAIIAPHPALSPEGRGSAVAMKTVDVKRYVLPKYKVNVTADKTFYLPKETIKTAVQADYVFGKPVSVAKVVVKASTFDVQFREFQTWNGQTDGNGHVKFDIKLPDYFIGQPLQKGNAMVKLDIDITDSADHKETITRTYTVSEQPIQISLIPEGGKLAPGVDNRIFAAAIYPDGRPASCDVKFWVGTEAKGEPLATLKTNAAGLAEFRINPKAEQIRQANFGQQNVEMLGGQQQRWAPQLLLDVVAQAADKNGNTAEAKTAVNCHPMGENILLRLDRAIYGTGDSIDIDVRSSAGMPTAYIDIVRDGQILLSRWVEVKDGKASHRLDVPQTLFGSLEVHAYQMLQSGEIIRDSRVVYVQPRNDLKVTATADQNVYQPGENGRIRFVVTDSNGKPTAAALGVIIVDEAVYALQDMQPGLEKVYFTLQEELMKPQVQVKFEHNIGDLVRQPILPVPQQQIAEVLLTSVRVNPPKRIMIDPAIERRSQVQQQVWEIGQAVFNFAWTKDNVLEFDKAANAWRFRINLLEEMQKAQQLRAEATNGPFGAKISVNDLTQLQSQFTPTRLGQAVTMQRMQQVAFMVQNFTNQHRAKFFKDNVWLLPESVIKEAIAGHDHLKFAFQDAWGQPLQLLKRKEKVNPPFGGEQFQFYELMSRGPDGKVDTKDDVKLSQWNAELASGQWLGNMWWSGKEDRFGIGPQAIFRGRDDLMRNRAFEQAARFGAGGGVGGAPAGPVPTAVYKNAAVIAAPVAEYGNAAGVGGPVAGVAPPRIREYFPETMLWQPALITDDKGVADLGVNFADSITTWRLSASASSMKGQLGGAQVPLKVFQDFFVDLDLPLNLTQNDEVAFPVAVYNYLETPQTVRIELQKENWFELLDADGLTRSLDLKPNQVTSIKFRIRAQKIGNQPLTVKAFGSKKSDAIKRIVEVVPNGEKIEHVASDRLEGNVTHAIDMPANTIPESAKIFVRVYPGIVSQLLEGTDAMLRMPGGCFEQTSSSAYPNILVVDYIKKTKANTPEILMKAEQYLNAGYQRLLTFERPGGGFDWWGSGEPLVWLSAYGLQEFSDMSKVYPIDRGIIDRTQAWLMKQRENDGAWSKIGATHAETIEHMGNPKLLLTSYVAWSLLDSGLAKDQLKPSIDYIRSHIKDAGDNAYILALAANALASYDPNDDSTLEAIQQLDKQRKAMPEWKAICFPTERSSIACSRGEHVTVETTALAILAMVKSGRFTNSVNEAVTYLIKAKGDGRWGSTSSTILSLKALLAAMGGPKIEGNIDFNVLLNGVEVARGRINEQNADVMQSFELKNVSQAGLNQVEIKVAGKTNLMYQIVARHFEPWKEKPEPTIKNGFDINVAYDRTKLSTNDLLRVKATLKYKGDLPANMVMLDLGIPPGFSVDAGDFAEMVDRKQVNKFSITSRQIILYLSDVRRGETKEFEYTLRPKYPLRARTPESTAYEYYTPTNRGVARPIELTVVEK